MLVFDIETDGLLETVSKFHCATALNPLTLEVINYEDPFELSKALSSTDLVVGHNIIGYDIPAMEALTGQAISTPRFDTLIGARLLSPEGLHSLEAYGKRLGFPKVEYNGGWSEVTEEMKRYCFQDVMLTAVLFLELIKRLRFFEEVGVPEGDIVRLQRQIRSLKYANEETRLQT
jgi:hypothetical protein